MKFVTGKAHGKGEPNVPRIERERLQLMVPGLDGAPVLRLSVDFARQRQGDGERVRLHAHLHACLGGLSAEAARRNSGQPDRGGAVAGRAVRRFGAGSLRRALAGRLGQRLSSLLLSHDVESWMEIETSSASLERGAAALLPVGDALRKIGSKLVPVVESPTLQVWAAPPQADGRAAQFALLRVDRAQLPVRLARLLGPGAFQLAAALGTVVERHDGGGDEKRGREGLRCCERKDVTPAEAR